MLLTELKTREVLKKRYVSSDVLIYKKEKQNVFKNEPTPTERADELAVQPKTAEGIFETTASSAPEKDTGKPPEDLDEPKVHLTTI